MSNVRCGEKEVTGCDYIHKCIAENFNYCHRFKEEIVRTGPIPRPEDNTPKKKIPETGCKECSFFTESPLNCSKDAAKSLTKLMTWPFKKICKHGQRGAKS